MLQKFVIIPCTIVYFNKTTVKHVDKGVSRIKENYDEIGQQKRDMLWNLTNCLNCSQQLF